MYKSSWESFGNSDDPDLVYYNASIVNNTTTDTANGRAFLDPPIKFNETRDTAIIKDASKYQFSIIRFSVNGGNKDLPLFIPVIQSGTGQTNPNLTEYGVALSFNAGGTSTNLVVNGDLEYVIYRPETLNRILAPIPPPPSNPNFVGTWTGPASYRKDAVVEFQNLFYQAKKVVPATVGAPNLNIEYWVGISDETGRPQDLSSRYYWVYTYEHWVGLVNETLEIANSKLYDKVALLPATPGVPTWATYGDWLQDNPTPRLWFDRSSGLFSFYFPESYLSPATTAKKYEMSLWLNVNMEGLFSNFNNEYWNSLEPYPNYYFPLTLKTPTPPGYANRILCEIEGIGNNIKTETQLDGTPSTKVYIQMTQDFASTSTLWSPIESIVFTSTLLPIMNEQTAPPNKFGTGNIGNSTTTSTSAFTPIITDVALDLSASGSQDYRKMIYYSPSAEYRMTDFQNAKTQIKNIDVQVFWKNRLDNQLYPMTMFNLSSVSIKIMFRRKLM